MLNFLYIFHWDSIQENYFFIIQFYSSYRFSPVILTDANTKRSSDLINYFIKRHFQSINFILNSTFMTTINSC